MFAHRRVEMSFIGCGQDISWSVSFVCLLTLTPIDKQPLLSFVSLPLCLSSVSSYVYILLGHREERHGKDHERPKDDSRRDPPRGEDEKSFVGNRRPRCLFSFAFFPKEREGKGKRDTARTYQRLQTISSSIFAHRRVSVVFWGRQVFLMSFPHATKDKDNIGVAWGEDQDKKRNLPSR